MTRKETIKQLEILKSYKFNYKQLVEKDVEALEYAIEVLQDHDTVKE